MIIATVCKIYVKKYLKWFANENARAMTKVFLFEVTKTLTLFRKLIEDISILDIYVVILKSISK